MGCKTSFNFINPENKIDIAQQESGQSSSVMGNKNLLKTALFNLFDNACKFSDNNEVNVSLSTINETLKLTISDCGQGIDDEEIEKIKAPFYRGKNTLLIKGSGIGLSLTDKIISLHKGTLNFKSKLGRGTEVVIVLPLV